MPMSPNGMGYPKFPISDQAAADFAHQGGRRFSSDPVCPEDGGQHFSYLSSQDTVGMAVVSVCAKCHQQLAPEAVEPKP